MVQYLRGLSIDLGSTSFRIDLDHELTTDRNHISYILDSLELGLGRAHLDRVRSYPAFIFSSTTVPDSEFDEDLPQDLLHACLACSRHFMQALWMVRDHCGVAGQVYMSIIDKSGAMRLAYHPHMAASAMVASCIPRDTAFSEGDLINARALYKKMHGLIPMAQYGEGKPRPSGLAGSSRIARALYVLQAARTEQDVVIKIVFYCIVLESIFSTDTAGVAHRVAERVANFVGAYPGERRAIFADVKSLYDLRSRVVHGSGLQASEIESARRVSESGDRHLREVIRKVLSDPELRNVFSQSTEKELRKYFLDLLFPD
jgi:hypothetical protein